MMKKTLMCVVAATFFSECGKEETNRTQETATNKGGAQGPMDSATPPATDTPETSPENTGAQDSDLDLEDDDNDGLTNEVEGKKDATDTDRDGIPDYLDADSDNDGILDTVEAGLFMGAPADSDGDGIPDFREVDSDGDGLADGDEDLDGDGEVDPGESDFRKRDTDDDGVTDLVERIAGTDPSDPQNNPAAYGNFVFSVPYEAPPSPREGNIKLRTSLRQVDLYLLEDISGSMETELAGIKTKLTASLDALSCAPGETSATCPSDCTAGCGDGECGAGEDVLSCPGDCPGVCGDGVCVGNETSDNCPQDCPADLCEGGPCCGNGICEGNEDVAACPTDCPGICSDGICHAGEQSVITGCIPDLWSGAGAFGTASPFRTCQPQQLCAPGSDGYFSYRNLIDVQPDPAATEGSLPAWCWGTSCLEPSLAAVFFTVTGMGTDAAEAAGFTVPQVDVPPRPACPARHRGYPCFRPLSLPIVLLVTDEPFSECYLPDAEDLGDCVVHRHGTMDPRSFPVVAGAVNDLGAKIIGIKGNIMGARSDELQLDLETLCEQTGSVDNAGNPFVFEGADEDAAQAVSQGVRTLARSVVLDMAARPADDEGDDVDAVGAFVDRIEIYPAGTPECSDWSEVGDEDADGSPETYRNVAAGTSLCWKIKVKKNTTVVPSSKEVLIFRAYVFLWANDSTVLDMRSVYFVVPPRLGGPVV